MNEASRVLIHSSKRVEIKLSNKYFQETRFWLLLFTYIARKYIVISCANHKCIIRSDILTLSLAVCRGQRVIIEGSQRRLMLQIVSISMGLLYFSGIRSYLMHFSTATATYSGIYAKLRSIPSHRLQVLFLIVVSRKSSLGSSELRIISCQ